MRMDIKVPRNTTILSASKVCTAENQAGRKIHYYNYEAVMETESLYVKLQGRIQDFGKDGVGGGGGGQVTVQY